MFDLVKLEKIVIIFLIGALLLGLAVLVYKKSHSVMNIQVRHESLETRENNIESEYPQNGQKININEAGAAELMKLKGVGKVSAERIVNYRSSRGRFNSAADIMNVKGIGPALFEKIKDRISTE